MLGDAVDYLTPNLQITVEFFDGKAGGHGAAADRGADGGGDRAGTEVATASSVTKPAKTETGLVVQVPPFINEGEKIRVDTARAPICRGRKAGLLCRNRPRMLQAICFC